MSIKMHGPKISFFMLVVLVITLLFILPAPNRIEAQTEETEAQTEEAEIQPEEVEVYTSAIANILNERQIRAGVREGFAPFGFFDEDGERVGFEIDIVKEFALRWLGDADAIDWVTVTPEDRIPALVEGQAHLVIAAMTETNDRNQFIDFSQNYFEDGQALLVASDSDITELADLSGRVIAVLEGSTAEKTIEALQQEALKRDVEITVDALSDIDRILQDLEDGFVDAFTSDSAFLTQIAAENAQFKVIGDKFTQELYAIGLPQGDYEFEELVNATLQEMKRDGTYDALFMKWFRGQTENLEPYDVKVLQGNVDYLLSKYERNFEGFSITRPDTSKLRLIQERGNVLIVGVKEDLPPFGYRNEQGERVGFDIALVKAIAAELGISEANIEFVTITSNNRIDKLLDGEVDLLAASMTHTWGRAQLINFSQTYFKDGQGLLVGQESNINNIVDLEGRIVAVLAGSTSIENIEAVAAAEGLNITIQPFEETSEAIAALLNQEVDAFTSDSAFLSFLADQNSELTVLGDRLTDEPYGLGLPQDAVVLRNLINCALQKIKTNGVYDQIYQTELGSNIPEPYNTPYDIEIIPGSCTSALNIAPPIDLEEAF